MTLKLFSDYIVVPNITTTQRDALTAENGMIIYNTTSTQFERRQAGAWGAFGGSSTVNPVTPAGRLTPTASTPLITSDVTAVTTLNYAPFNGNRLWLYNGSAWVETTFSNTTLSLSGNAANSVFDVFGYLNAGNLALESLAWTNTTTRATAITKQDGWDVKSGDATRLYLGTYATTSVTGQTEKSYLRSFIWNRYNQYPHILRVRETTDSWSYGTATWRSLNNSTANRVEFVLGDSTRVQMLHTMSTVTRTGYAGIALDATNTTDAYIKTATGVSSLYQTVTSFYDSYVSVGYHYLQLTEKGDGVSATMYGDAGVPNDLQNGGIGVVWC